MSNNVQNKFKFTAKPATFIPPQPPRPPPSYTNNRQGEQQSNKQPEEILIDDDDDDLLDISDNELIRASQAVESSLIFTNNVHHATSNAITIFSQLPTNRNDDGGANCMGPPSQLPPSNMMYSNSNMYDANEQPDDFKFEINKLKTENMQKDGEVKILRGLLLSQHKFF
jgi:hypothetical protein